MDYSRFFNKVGLCKRPIYNDFLETFTSTSSISLGEGMPNVENCPFERITIDLKDGTQLFIEDSELEAILKYLPLQGYPPFIKQLQKLQKKWHSPPRNDWDVIAVTGSQDGMSKVFDILVESGDPIMIQVPSFFAIVGKLKSLTPDFIQIKQDAVGIVTEEIARVCEERRQLGRPMPKFLYVNPNGNNPTGTVLPEDRKRRIYELAQKYDFLILEDDPYYHLCFLDERPSSFLSMDTDGRVVRFDSFSKVISPGFRLAIITVHGDLMRKLFDHICNSTLHSSSLSQIFVYKMLDNWTTETLEQYLNEIRLFYQQKRNAILRIVNKYLTGLAEWMEPMGGMFLWIKIIVLNDVLKVVKNCLPNGVSVTPGHIFNYDFTASDQHIRLSYGIASVDDIDKGVSILARVIREEVDRKGRIDTSF